MKKRILFVDDEPNVLSGLQRMLRSMRSEWDMEFAAGGREALRTLASKPFDVVVTDMRMPEMDGCRLLDRVKDLHPQAVRIILSGYSDQDMILSSVGLAHQFLSKPCDAGTLKKTICRACGLSELLADESLVEVISKIKSLPSLPSLYAEVVAEVDAQDGSLAKVSEIISKDAGMSAKLLQLANSAFFGLPARISNIMRAVNLLGLETIKALILTIKIFSQFDGTRLPFALSLWDHSISTGMIARSIATREALGQNLIDEAFMAGLLHDIGKLILFDKLPDKYSEIHEYFSASGRQLWEAEQEILGTTHAQIGAYLMGIWGLTESLVEAIAYHHTPSECSSDSFGILTAVHLASAFEHCKSGGKDSNRLDYHYLEKIGVSDKFNEELQGAV